MELYLGIITEVLDEETFQVKFDIPGRLKDGVANPFDLSDKPEKGDPIALFQLESVLSMSFLYKKLRVTTETLLSLGESYIKLSGLESDSKIEISSPTIEIVENESFKYPRKVFAHHGVLNLANQPATAMVNGVPTAITFTSPSNITVDLEFVSDLKEIP